VAGAPLFIPPIWRIVSDSESPSSATERSPSLSNPAREIPLRLHSGPGFGTGAHETTQLCLQAIYAFHPRGPKWRLLDFGSGSGILSIAAAKLGAEVVGIEIDEPSIEHAEANVRSNEVRDRVVFGQELEEAGGKFELVVANILLAVLVAHAEELVLRLAPGGTLVLSGLVGTDVPVAIGRYSPLLGGARPEVFERGDFRALVWQKASP
jgi:ribosomal protein L11 methyltransferase